MQAKMLPQNLECERAVLGCILIDPASYEVIADRLSPNDFYRDSHRTIYETMVNLWNNRISPDFMAIYDDLMRAGKFEQVGGGAYLAELQKLMDTSGNIAHFAKKIRESAKQRRLIHYAGQVAAFAYAEDGQAMEKAEQLLFSIQEKTTANAFTSMPDLMHEYIGELEFLHANRGSIIGVPTGYDELDACLGGMQKSDLILLAARPSVGKTSLGLCIGYNAAHKGKKVAVFSLEMGKKLLARRLMSMHSKVDMQRLRSGWVEEQEWEKVMNSAGRLSQLPIWINDTAGNPISSMRSQLRQLQRETGGIDLVVVDYIGLIEPDMESAKRDNLVQQVSAISRGLKTLAREFDVPVLALAQLSRAVESRQNKRPMLADLRDSGSLEQDADVVLFIYREDYYAMREQRENYTPDNLAEVHIAKHRNGPTGEVSLYFQPDQTMFYNLHKLDNA